MSYETYHIPVNFTDAGKLFGVFEIRNAVETVLLNKLTDKFRLHVSDEMSAEPERPEKSGTPIADLEKRLNLLK